jgi:omega-amidase
MDLSVSVLQTDISWENINENLVSAETMLSNLPKDTDIAVLPEMFATGFSMDASKICQYADGEIAEWLREQAQKRGIAIAAGIALKDAKGTYSNSIAWAGPDGEFKTCAKRHLFASAGEDKIYSPGKEICVIEYKGWKIRLLVCYDLRFPVWSRNADFSSGKPCYQYHCAIYIANWPSSRQLQWQALLQARAIENQAYIIGANRVGTDASKLEYSGGSAIYSPIGKIMCEIENGGVGTASACLSDKEIEKLRSRFPFVNDADFFRF